MRSFFPGFGMRTVGTGGIDPMRKAVEAGDVPPLPPLRPSGEPVDRDAAVSYRGLADAPGAPQKHAVKSARDVCPMEHPYAGQLDGVMRALPVPES